MATFTCYLPENLLQRLDEHVEKTPGATRSGILRVSLEQLLVNHPATVKQVFAEALPNRNRGNYGEGPVKEFERASRADLFHRATQR